jgi:hypothetical protein
LGYIENLNFKSGQGGPSSIFSEFIKYTKSNMVKQIEDSITFSLAICLKSNPKLFVQFLSEQCDIDYSKKQLRVIWPQFRFKGVEPDLVLGFSSIDDTVVDSCLVIEAKVKPEFREQQLIDYLSPKENCQYLFITVDQELDISEYSSLKSWKITTWQGLTNFLLNKQLEDTLWNDFIRHKASNGVVIDLRGEPKMEFENIEELNKKAYEIMDGVATHIFENRTTLVEKQNLYLYPTKREHLKHMYWDQFQRNARFTIACDNGNDNSYFLFGLFRYIPENEEEKKWYAGAIIERHPKDEAEVFSNRLKEAGIEQRDWVFPEDSRTKGTSFEGPEGLWLVSMKSRLLSSFLTKNEVVLYINSIIDEVMTPYFTKICTEIIYERK